MVDSYIDGSKMVYYSSQQRSFHRKVSAGCVFALILLGVGAVVSIYVIRYTISPTVGVSYAQTIASVANAVQIQVLNYVYSALALSLTNAENLR